METFTIKSPADLLSFIGHTLGFWPHESLVCVTVDTDRLGATLRVDLPMHDGGELGYARTVAGYLTHDPNATAVLFAVYTSTPWDASQPKPRAAIIAALTGVLAERGITISDGLLVGEKTFIQYDGDPSTAPQSPWPLITLIANFQFAGIRDQLIANIPAIKEPADQVLFAQTQANRNAPASNGPEHQPRAPSRGC
jgi:hypothetical protein